MLRIFRINDPYRLILVFIVIVIYKIPLFFNLDLLTVPELKYLLVGEKLASGAVLYKDLWENIGPLAGWFYMLIDLLFGKSLFTHRVISIVLLIIQAGIFNVMIINRKLYNENTYIPAFFYGIFGLLFFDVTSLSPEFLGLTFILFSFNSLFNHLELRRKNDINLINLGIYLGTASLFYAPYFIYVFAVAIGLVLFTNTIRRRYLLMLFGSLFPIFLITLYYYMIDAEDQLVTCLMWPLFDLSYRNFFDLNTLIYIVAIPLFYLVISIFKTFQSHGFTNYQVRVQSLFFLFLIFQIVFWFLWSQKAGSSLIQFIPILSFFYTHFFLLLKKKLWRIIHFNILLISLIIMYASPVLKLQILEERLNLTKLIIDVNKGKDSSDKKILVLGEDLSFYYNNSIATPYFNWSICKSLFQNVNDYQNIIKIYESFKMELPDVIIDEHQVFPEVMKRIPEIRNQYQKTGINRYEKTSS